MVYHEVVAYLRFFVSMLLLQKIYACAKHVNCVCFQVIEPYVYSSQRIGI